MDPPRCNRLNVAILDEKKESLAISAALIYPRRLALPKVLLVPLGCDIAACTPAAYLRHRL